MQGMFGGAYVFNQNIGTWNVSSVTNMQGMFGGASVFNQNISTWNVSSVTNMINMFVNASSFNQDLSGWCVTNIPTTPTNFSLFATAWSLPKPVWGTCPTPTPTPTRTPTSTPTNTQTPTTTPTQTPTNTQTGTAAVTTTPTQTGTQTPTTTTTLTATPTQTPTNTQTGTAAVTTTPTQTGTQTPTTTTTLTATPTQTPTNTQTGTAAVTTTPTQTRTQTPTTTTTLTATPTQTPTNTQTGTAAVTTTPTQTRTQTPTTTTTLTATPTPTTPATMFSRSSSDYANEYFTCLGSVSGIDFLYQTPGAGGGISPAVSAQMYTNPGLTATWTPGGSGWYLLEYNGTFYAVLPNANGVLQTVYTCATLPSQTPTQTRTQTPTTTTTLTATQTPTKTPTSTTTLTATPTQTPTNSPTSTTTLTATPTQTPTPTQLAIPYNISSFGYGNTYDACAGSTTIVVYAPPGYTTPMVGMIFYDNSNLTVPHNGGSSGQWFLLEKGGTTWAAQVYTDGVLLDYVACSILPSQTPTPAPTNTPTSTPPTPPSCECYQTTNTTAESVNITYTPCGDPETTVSVPGYGTLNFCVEPLTTIYPDAGLTYPALCNISCLYDGVDCSTCGAPPVSPSNTPSNSPTPPSGVYFVVNSVYSLDVDINDVTVDGVSVTYVNGDNFPVNGNGGYGTFQTTLTGTRTVVVYYGSTIPGQTITLTGSDTATDCVNVPGNGSDTFTVNFVEINSNNSVFITAIDGTSCA